VELITDDGSLAMAEMKILLRAVYEKFTTTVADEMTSSMEVDDQIISSRPKGQKCLLVFEERARGRPARTS
jgi:hypothetical protein